MSQSVMDFFTWMSVNIPAFLWSHPVIDLLAVAVAVWVVSLVFCLLFHRFA